RVTSIAMLRALSRFFAPKCPEGRRRLDLKVPVQGSALKYGGRGLANSVLGFHVVRRGFSAPWGLSNTRANSSQSIKERKRRKRRGEKRNERNNKSKRSERGGRLSVIARRKKAEEQEKANARVQPVNLRSRISIPPDVPLRTVCEIAAEWKAPAKRYRVETNTPFGTPARPKPNEIIKLHPRETLITLRNLAQLVNAAHPILMIKR
ncbi:hypothetical protein X777_10837, partial [Ooceraea biroi]